jgi:hypothetical protein
MTMVRTDLGNTRESARRLRFEPTGAVTQTNVQKAIEQVATTPQAISGTAVNAAASPYTVLASDTVLYVDSSAGPVNILLQASADRLGVPLVVKDVGGAANTNNITLTPNGAETLDSLAALVINSDYGGFRLNPRTASYTVAP